MKLITSIAFGILALNGSMAMACEIVGTGYSVQVENAPGFRKAKISLFHGNDLVEEEIGSGTLTIGGVTYKAPGMTYVANAMGGDSFESPIVSGACKERE